MVGPRFCGNSNFCVFHKRLGGDNSRLVQKQFEYNSMTWILDYENVQRRHPKCHTKREISACDLMMVRKSSGDKFLVTSTNVLRNGSQKTKRKVSQNVFFFLIFYHPVSQNGSVYLPRYFHTLRIPNVVGMVELMYCAMMTIGAGLHQKLRMASSLGVSYDTAHSCHEDKQCFHKKGFRANN